MTADQALASYPCPVCLGDQIQPLYRVNSFSIVRCSGCGMVYVNPRIKNDDLFTMYADKYFHSDESGYEDYELTAALRVKTFRAWYKEIAGCLKTTGGTALDIGCAAGYFLQILQEMGWQAEGIELEREMRGTVSDKGFTVYDTPLEFFEPRKKYSLITLFDVFEHLPNLHRNIEKLTSILDAQGSIALVTPDFNSFQRKVFSRRWFQYKPREHIQYFTLETLRRAVTGHGLKIVHHSSCGQYADTTFLYNRLKRYGFTPMADVFNLCVSLLRLGNKSWYADTGSMLAVLQKKD